MSDVLRARAAALGLPFSALPPQAPPPELLALLPMPYARRYGVLPLAADDTSVTVATSDPDALAPLDDLRFLFARPVRPVVIPAGPLAGAITRAYDWATRAPADTVDAAFTDEVDGQLDVVARELEEPRDLLEAGDEAPVIRLVNALLCQAVKDGASDVHVDPQERHGVVRLRVDGLLHDVLEPPARWLPAIASRVKVMAGLDIAERRLPQDGRLRVRIGGRDIDVRVSVIPTTVGERVVLRILDRAATLLDLGTLGMSPAIATDIEHLLTLSHGIVLVTGPTGSGKTTTLYAMLRRLMTGERNILTIEDPVEYQLDGVGQMQVHPRIGLGFAAGLRSLLRQDPDVILVGEIRDRETVEIAMQAALTGHLVLSTLHTNDAASAITRLLDMGVEPYLIASSVVGILAQRLVRCRCCACDGRGCAPCRGTGYRGRLGIFELLRTGEELRGLVMRGADAQTIRGQAIGAGMTTLADDGFTKVQAGLTTEAEVLRTTREAS